MSFEHSLYESLAGVASQGCPDLARGRSARGFYLAKVLPCALECRIHLRSFRRSLSVDQELRDNCVVPLSGGGHAAHVASELWR